MNSVGNQRASSEGDLGVWGKHGGNNVDWPLGHQSARYIKDIACKGHAATKRGAGEQQENMRVMGKGINHYDNAPAQPSNGDSGLEVASHVCEPGARGLSDTNNQKILHRE